jgi:chaperone modulatory protein CbpM
MIDTSEFCRMADIRPGQLEAWIEASWLSPSQGRHGWRFSTIDLMRARLILDLSGPMGVNDEGVAVILHLVDQIHGLRRALRGATQAVDVSGGAFLLRRASRLSAATHAG